MKSLRERILNAEAGICVGEVVFPERAQNIPPYLCEMFLRMRIAWANDRHWGLSFKLGADVVKLGHRRGDHLATHPHLYGLTNEGAENLLRIQLEGVLLHELGHAVLDAVSPLPAPLPEYIADAFAREGTLSTYFGMGPRADLFSPDGQHEAIAEAFRYWCHNDPTLQRRFPTVMHHVRVLTWAAERQLS